MMHIRLCSLELKELDKIYPMAQLLARYFPQPGHYVAAIHELLLNAVEHGNLGIGYELKTELLRQGKWQEEITSRLQSPHYAQKEVDITVCQNTSEISLIIADQGEGFDWEKYVSPPANSLRPNGRGLWIAYNSKFDSISFNAHGNRVTCTLQHNHAHKTEGQFPQRPKEVNLCEHALHR